MGNNEVKVIKLREIDNVTENYEVQMLLYTFHKMADQADASLYNVFYECFAIHARNLAWRMLCTDEVYAILRRIEDQVLTYPREEPTFEKKVKFEDCKKVFWWIIDKYKEGEKDAVASKE